MTFRVLCISGGGYLGLYSARVLSRIEQVSGAPIARSFDLICGTSVGAVTALALSQEIPAAEVESTIVRFGPKVFAQPPHFLGIRMVYGMLRALFRPRYSEVTLAKGIKDLLGEATLADARCKLAIPVVNMTTGQIEIFKTPHVRDLIDHASFKMADIGMAATAAPTYFPLAAVGDSLYVDGALFANAPDLVGLHEAEYYLDIPTDDIRMLSIGTTTASFSLTHRYGRQYGAMRWFKHARLYSTILASQQQLTLAFLNHHMGAHHLRIDSIRAPGHELDLGFDSADSSGTHTILSLADHAFENSMKHDNLEDFITPRPAPPLRLDAGGAANSPGRSAEGPAEGEGAAEAEIRRIGRTGLD